MKFMKQKELKKLIKKREKEGIICMPTGAGYMFYNPETGKTKDIWVKE